MAEIQKQHDGSQLFLCSKKGWLLANIFESIASGELAFAGLFLFGHDKADALPQSVVHVTIPTLIVTNHVYRELLQATLSSPFVTVVKFPGDKNDAAFLDLKSQWLCRTMIEFAEAECARQRYIQPSVYRSKL